MPLPDSLALRLGRSQSNIASTGTGTSVTPANGSGLSASANVSLGGGRDSLVLLAALVIAVIALSYWTR